MTRKGKAAALLAATLVVGLGGAALAQPGPGPGAGHGPGRHHHRGAGGFTAGEAFARADANDDGRVTREEGLAWLQSRFAEVDANRDSAVTLEEVQAYWQQRRGNRPVPERAQARMRQRGAAMFRFVDADLNGRVTFEELRPVAEAMYRAADADRDGALSREEVRRRPAPRRQAPAEPAQPGRPGAPAANDAQQAPTQR